MEKKKAIMLGAGGAGALALLGAAAFALAPEHRGLAGMDLNNDGQIAVAEIQQTARTRFAERDANSDGRLTGEELPRGRGGRGRGHGGRHHDRFEAEGPAPAPAATGNDVPTSLPIAAPLPPGRGMARADVNGDGAVTLPEFYLQLATRAARADANRDGTISAEELAAHRPRRGRR